MPDQPEATYSQRPGVRHFGNSREYLLDRMRREGLTRCVEAVERGELSAFEIAVALGWQKRRPILGTGNMSRAKRREIKLRTILQQDADEDHTELVDVAADENDAGGPQAGEPKLSRDQERELWLGPAANGSLFASREQLQQAWAQHGARVQAIFAVPGRRAAGWWEFEFPGPYPGFNRERSFLYTSGFLSDAERVELETYWRRAFEHAEALGDAAARRKHLRWADVPAELARRWRGEHKRAPAA
jgi:hypothetical protein